MYEVKSLQFACVDLLKRNLTFDNAVDVWKTADELNIEELKLSATYSCHGQLCAREPAKIGLAAAPVSLKTLEEFDPAGILNADVRATSDARFGTSDPYFPIRTTSKFNIYIII